MAQKPPAWIHTVLVSALCAAAVWALSPVITGLREPWDASSHYYLLALLVAGLASGLVSPRVRWAYFTGAVAGQFLYILIFLETGPLIAVGVVMLCIHGVPFLLAALLACHARNRLLGWARKSPGR